MKRNVMAIACLLAIACGGGGGSKGNPATQASFDYTQAAPSTADSQAVASTGSAVASLTAFDASPSATSAGNVVGALFDAADQALGPTSMLGVAPVSRALPLVNRVRAQALSVGGMPDSALPSGCGTVAADVVTFDPAKCTFTDSSNPGDVITVKLGGHVARLGPGAGEWTLTMTANLSMSNGQVTVDVAFDDSGHVAIALPAITGHEEAGMRVVGRGQGQVLTLAVAQAADVAVSTTPPATNCGMAIAAGSFEAKRVWLEVPQQLRDQDPSEYRNKGVKITWTAVPGGCSTATAQIVVR